MCGGGRPDTPDVVQRDPKAEAEQAAREAAIKANAETATRRRRRRESSLLATGARGLTTNPGATLLATAQGKQTLGS